MKKVPKIFFLKRHDTGLEPNSRSYGSERAGLPLSHLVTRMQNPGLDICAEPKMVVFFLCGTTRYLIPDFAFVRAKWRSGNPAPFAP